LLHFIPTKKTREDEKAKRLIGNTITVADNGKSRLILLQGLSPKETSLKGRVQEECEIYLLACPVIRPYTARQSFADFKQGEKPVNFVFMDWGLRHEGQFATVPATERLTKIKPRDFQQKLDL
jgi:hypothetical protein